MPFHTRSTVRAAAGGAALASLLAAGCVDPLGTIDRKLDEMVRSRSDLLGPSAASPSREYAGAVSYEVDRMDAETPRTINPNLAEIDIEGVDPLDPDRSAAERLAGYIEHALGVGISPDGAPPREVLDLNLERSFRRLQLTGRAYLTAEEQYLFSAIALLQTRHLFNPRFFNDTTVSLSGSAQNGAFDHAVDILNSLQITKRLRGGVNLAASWLVDATQQLTERATDEYVQSSSLVLSADIPLLQGAGPAADEDIISAERNVVFAARDFERTRRELLVGIANTYFGLLQQQAVILNQQQQVQSFQFLLDQTIAEVDAGRQTPAQIGIARSNLLSSQARLASLQENYVLSLDRFKVTLGVPIETPVNIRPIDIELQVPAVSMEEAVDAALNYRLDLQNQRDGVDDQRRAIRNARNAILPELDLSGSVTIPTDPGDNNDDDTGGLDIDAEELDYTMQAVLSLPLDRRIQRLELRDQMVRFQQVTRNYYQFRDNVIVDARDALRNLELARFELQLAEQGVVTNERRLEEQNLKRDQFTTQEIIDSEQQLLDARNDRDAALAELRSAILEFLLATGQLRVGRSGDLLTPPGLDPPRRDPLPQADTPDEPGAAAPDDRVGEPAGGPAGGPDAVPPPGPGRTDPR